jgi:hypothetical protein
MLVIKNIDKIVGLIVGDTDRKIIEAGDYTDSHFYKTGNRLFKFVVSAGNPKLNNNSTMTSYEDSQVIVLAKEPVDVDGRVYEMFVMGLRSATVIQIRKDSIENILYFMPHIENQMKMAKRYYDNLKNQLIP